MTWKKNCLSFYLDETHASEINWIRSGPPSDCAKRPILGNTFRKKPLRRRETCKILPRRRVTAQVLWSFEINLWSFPPVEKVETIWKDVSWMLTSVCFPFEIRNLKFKFLQLGATAITVSDQAISAPTLSDTWGPPENLCSEVIIIECYYWNIEDHWSICWSVYLRCNLYGPEPNLSENAWSLFPFCFNVQQVKRDIGDAGCIHFLCLWGSKALRPKRDFPYLKCSKAQQVKLICPICLCLLWSGQLPSQKSQRCTDLSKTSA